MGTAAVVLGVIVLLYVGVMAGLLIYSNTGKDQDSKGTGRKD